MFVLPQYSMMSTISTTLILGLIFIFLSRQSHRRYMVLWGICWIFYSFMFFLDFSHLTGLYLSNYYIVQRQAISLIGAFLFLTGTYDFFQLKMPQIFFKIFLCFLCSIFLSSLSTTIFAIGVIPNIMFSSLLLILSGCIFLSYSWTQNLPEKIIASFLIILWGVFLNHFGFTINYTGIAIYNYFMGIFLVNLLTVVLMIIHFKKLRFLMEKREECFRLLVENSADSMFLYDYNKQAFQYVSPSIEPLLGVTDQMLYLNSKNFFQNIQFKEENTKSLSIFETPISQPSMALFSYLRDHVVIKWVEMYYIPIVDSLGKVSAVEGILHDITNKIKAEENLKLSETARKELIENISHEVRTPVTLIQGYTESMLHKVVPDNAIPSYLKMIHSKTLVLTTLLDDLIQASHVTSQNMEYRFYELNAFDFFIEIIEQTEFQTKSEQRSFHCENWINKSAMIIIDPARIQQVVTNLVNNAIRHTMEGGKISIICTSIPNQNLANAPKVSKDFDPLTIPEGMIQFTINDNGNGVAHEDLPHIFERKFIGKNRIAMDENSINDNRQRTGLGLFISKQIIKHHSGVIWAENNDLGGASFSFTLPYYKE